MKIELRYPNDPKAQEQWELICRGVHNAVKNRNKFVKDYKAGKISKTIFNAARFLSYTRTCP